MKLAHKLVAEGLLTGTPPPSMTGAKSRDPVPAMQRHFSTADIDKIEIYLDSALQDKSIGSESFRYVCLFHLNVRSNKERDKRVATSQFLSCCQHNAGFSGADPRFRLVESGNSVHCQHFLKTA